MSLPLMGSFMLLSKKLNSLWGNWPQKLHVWALGSQIKSLCFCCIEEMYCSESCSPVSGSNQYGLEIGTYTEILPHAISDPSPSAMLFCALPCIPLSLFQFLDVINNAFTISVEILNDCKTVQQYCWASLKALWRCECVGLGQAEAIRFRLVKCWRRSGKEK